MPYTSIVDSTSPPTSGEVATNPFLQKIKKELPIHWSIEAMSDRDGYLAYARYRGSVRTDDIDALVRVVDLAEELYTCRVHLHNLKNLRKCHAIETILHNANYVKNNCTDIVIGDRVPKLLKLIEDWEGATEARVNHLLSVLVNAPYEPVDFMPYEERAKRKD